MKAKIFSTIAAAALCSGMAAAQSAVDAYTLTPVELRGTARFVGMGGAFTSLGGDISCMTQNPAGLGIYRSSDIGLTFDVGGRSYSAATDMGTTKRSETKANFDNFGYVGVANLNGALRAFQWGVSYNRLASFNRRFAGRIGSLPTSLTNYVAGITNGTIAKDMMPEEDPYYNDDLDWLSVLSYNSFMINPDNADETHYAGLFQPGTKGDAVFETRQHGYTDEYNIDFAGNVSDIVFWGVGVGIVDMSFSSESDYSEALNGALVYDDRSNTLTSGFGSFDLYNARYVSGTGANIKLGVIVRPIEMLRIGAAIHTPTWMTLNHTGYGETSFDYTPDDYTGDKALISSTRDTPDYQYNSRLNTPWRFMVGASAVVGSKAIVSLDYERVAYNDMNIKYQVADRWGSNYVESTYDNENIKNYYKAANIIRAGIEYRVLPSLSLRLGYNYQSSAVGSNTQNAQTVISTSGTDPSYVFNNDTQNICVGLGYRYRSWYIDAAYMHTHRTGTYHAYTPFFGINSPSASLTDNYNTVVISTGLRF